jgi:hypothetical protein
MAKKKKVPKLQIPEDTEELEATVKSELKRGKKLMRKERGRLEADIKEHPLEYVVGAFVVGLIMGKLTK